MERLPEPPAPPTLRQRVRAGVAKVRGRGQQPVRPPVTIGPEPYLDDEALIYFHRRVGECATYVEYGSGASTVIALRAGAMVFSVESDSAFAELVRVETGPSDRLHLDVVDVGAVGDWGIPVDKMPTASNVSRWAAYPTSPWRAITATRAPLPEFVLVDGRFRVASALTSLIALADKPDATLMVDDYSYRPEYWVLEALADLVESPGRAAVFSPRPGLRDRLTKAEAEYRSDWR